MANKQNIYDRLHAVESYKPGSVDAFTDWTLQAGDVIEISAEGQKSKMPIYAMDLVWNGATQTNLSATGNEKRNEIAKKTKQARAGYGRSASQQEILDGAVSEITNANGHINLIAKQLSGGNVTDWASIDVTPSAIVSTVGANGIVSMINQSANSIKIEAEHIKITGSMILDAMKVNDRFTVNMDSSFQDIYGSVADFDEFDGGTFHGSAFYVGYGASAIDLGYHGHKLSSEVEDGKVTITLSEITDEDSESNSCFFNIADTEFYKNKMSAVTTQFVSDSHSFKYDEIADTRWCDVEIKVKLTTDPQRTKTVSTSLNVTDYWNQAFNAGKASGSGGTLTIKGSTIQSSGTWTFNSRDTRMVLSRGHALAANMQVWAVDSDGKLAGKIMDSASSRRYVYTSATSRTSSATWYLDDEVKVSYTK